MTNEEANRLTQQINVNQRTIDRQRKALETLKADYADMIRYSYASNQTKPVDVFIFIRKLYRPTSVFNTSNSMLHFAKRRPLNCPKTQTLQALNKTLLAQKTRKEALVEENRLSKI